MDRFHKHYRPCVMNGCSVWVSDTEDGAAEREAHDFKFHNCTVCMQTFPDLRRHQRQQHPAYEVKELPRKADFATIKCEVHRIGRVSREVMMACRVCRSFRIKAAPVVVLPVVVEDEDVVI